MECTTLFLEVEGIRWALWLIAGVHGVYGIRLILAMLDHVMGFEHFRRAR